MADQVSPVGGLSAGSTQGLQPAAVPLQPKPTQNASPESETKPDSAATSEERGKTVSKENLETAAKTVEEYLQQSNPDLQFSMDKETGMYCIKVVDPSTEKVIRQIPSEETLKLAKRLQTQWSKDASGVLIDSEG